MATVIGQLPEFDSQKDSITAYKEQVKLFIEANGIEEGQKVAVLLSVIGGKTYDLLWNLLARWNQRKSRHYHAILNQSIAERYHFH